MDYLPVWLANKNKMCLQNTMTPQGHPGGQGQSMDNNMEVLMSSENAWSKNNGY